MALLKHRQRHHTNRLQRKMATTLYVPRWNRISALCPTLPDSSFETNKPHRTALCKKLHHSVTHIKCLDKKKEKKREGLQLIGKEQPLASSGQGEDLSHSSKGPQLYPTLFQVCSPSLSHALYTGLQMQLRSKCNAPATAKLWTRCHSW